MMSLSGGQAQLQCSATLLAHLLSLGVIKNRSLLAFVRLITLGSSNIPLSWNTGAHTQPKLNTGPAPGPVRPFLELSEGPTKGKGRVSWSCPHLHLATGNAQVGPNSLLGRGPMVHRRSPVLGRSKRAGRTFWPLSQSTMFPVTTEGGPVQRNQALATRGLSSRALKGVRSTSQGSGGGGEGKSWESTGPSHPGPEQSPMHLC